MLKINGIVYYIDVDEIFRFVVKPIENEDKDMGNTEISEYYKVNSLGLNEIVSKELREIKVNSLQIDSVKYDFLKMLLDEAFRISIDVFLTDNIESEDIILLNEIEMGSIYSINTLKKLNILKEEII